MPKITLEDIVAEFNRPVTLNEHGCWLWLGSTDKYGYARYGETLVYGYACRMSGMHSPPGTDYMHQCPNKNCINPDHFLVGTHKENMNDTNRQQMGPKGRLSEEQIARLDSLLKMNVLPKSDIARLFGVSPQWITKFQKGEFKYAKPL